MKQNRIDRIFAALKEMNVQQMLIVDPMSIYYLTGIYQEPFERFYGLLLREDGKNVFFLNKLFNAPGELGVEKVWYSDTDDVADVIMPYINPDWTLGVDKDIRARFLLPLMERNAAKGFVNSSIAIDTTRGIKDEEEQEKMRVASHINDLAIAKFKELVHDGVTEKEVADQTLKIYQDLGADGFSFEPLVAFGKNAADPHHSPDNTVIKPGDCVLFDVGCIKDGYCSDMTRTFFYKEVSDKDRFIYNTTRAANEAAIAKIKPGIKLKELDKTARDLISNEGYGENFTHRLGHFIGLSEHEFGDVSSTNETEAKAGMIFSIEPGIYVTDEVGVRVEDLVLVTPEGVEVLNSYPKELEIIGK
ncbi:M24 family metallopeptidase [Lachnospira multipara]|uniref:Xaa-Pro dipeptidase n=1 Tax=Lachnospira multipara TaxID=28051 RepID=A0A1H5TVY5_9FIRM|nr:Xaa-Pro peptidase family protein [Lachnospira multipara]SEF66964.1 Xaa-Pro dipeptidase [Lachnospira multipara]